MRKRLIVLFVVLFAIAGFTPIASADVFTLQQNQLMQLWQVFENPSSASTFLNSKTSSGDGVSYTASLGYPGPSASGWAAIGIGANFWGTSSTGSGATTAQVLGSNSLVGFSRFDQMFTNVNDDPWYVNIFLNTGYTDPPYSEPNNYYESVWAEILPNQSTIVSIDLSGVLHLNHVSNIGFQIGGNMQGLGSGSPSNPDYAHILVRPVPEPASMLLFGSGLIGIAGAVRRRMRR